MSDDRAALIRSKNLAYTRLEAAHLAIHKQGRRGPIPPAWLARLVELEREYRAALAELNKDRTLVRT